MSGSFNTLKDLPCLTSHDSNISRNMRCLLKARQTNVISIRSTDQVRSDALQLLVKIYLESPLELPLTVQSPTLDDTSCVAIWGSTPGLLVEASTRQGQEPLFWSLLEHTPVSRLHASFLHSMDTFRLSSTRPESPWILSNPERSISFL